MFLVIGLVLGIIIVAVLAVREMFLFGAKRDAYGIRRLTLRMSTAALLIFLLASILVGVQVFHLGSPEDTGNIGLWAAFWGCISILTGGVFCLVVADLRTVTDERRDDAGRLWRDIAQTIADHEASRSKEP